jgi:hypothetical protein
LLYIVELVLVLNIADILLAELQAIINNDQYFRSLVSSLGLPYQWVGFFLLNLIAMEYIMSNIPII